MVAFRTTGKHPLWMTFEFVMWVVLFLLALALLLTTMTTGAGA